MEKLQNFSLIGSAYKVFSRILYERIFTYAKDNIGNNQAGLVQINQWEITSSQFDDHGKNGNLKPTNKQTIALIA